jgi:hypothetical protein
MGKEHQLQNDASEAFVRSTNSDVAPQNTQQVSSARTQEGGQQHDQQQADVTASTDVEPGQRTQAKTRQESPFLSILMERGMAITVARELWQEREEKAERQRQSSKASYYRQKEADHEGLKEKQRVRKARQRARERPEAKTQEEGQ